MDSASSGLREPSESDATDASTSDSAGNSDGDRDFSASEAVLAALDVSLGRPSLIGVYTYTRIAWDAPEPETAPEEAKIG